MLLLESIGIRFRYLLKSIIYIKTKKKVLVGLDHSKN